MLENLLRSKANKEIILINQRKSSLISLVASAVSHFQEIWALQNTKDYMIYSPPNYL